MVAAMPLTPASEEWDRSSIIKDMPGMRPKVILKIGKEPPPPPIKKANKKIKSKRKDEQKSHVDVDSIVEGLLRKEKQVADLSKDDILALINQPSTISDSCAFHLLSSLADLTPTNGLLLVHLCLSMNLCSDDVRGGLMAYIGQIWCVIVNGFEIPEVREYLTGALEGLQRFISSVILDEAWLMSMCTWCIKTLNANSPPPGLSILLIRLLIVAGAKSDSIRKYVYEEALATQGDTQLQYVVQFARGTTNWITYFYCLEPCFKIQTIPLGVSGLKSTILGCFKTLDVILSLSETNKSTKLLQLCALIGEACQLISFPEWFPLIFVLKQLFSGIIRLLLAKDTKSDIRLKLLDCGGMIAAQFRELELSSNDQNCCQDLWACIAKVETTEALIQPEIISTLMIQCWDTESPNINTNSCSLKEYRLLVGSFLQKSELGPHSDKFVALLLQTLNDSSPLIRAKSIRELNRILKRNDRVIQNSNFLTTLQKRMNDSSPLVREAAVDFIVSSSDGVLSAEIFGVLVDKIADSSVAVRKRAIRVASDHIQRFNDPDRSAELRAALMVESYSDSKGTSELAYATIVENWIIPVIGAQHILKAAEDNAPARQILAAFTAEIVKVIRCPRNDLPAFKACFKKFALDSNIGVEFQSICGGVVDLLFETLVTSVEDGSDSAARFILAALVVVLDDHLHGAEKHFRLLSGLVMSDDCETVEHVLKLLKLCFKGENHLLYRQVPDLCSNLTKLAFRGSENIVRGALECLFLISITNTLIKNQLAAMYQKLSNFLAKHSPSQDLDVVPLLCRGIYAISVITRLGTEYGYEWVPSLASTAESIKLVVKNVNSSVQIFGSMAAAELLVSDPLASLQEPLRQVVIAGFECGIDAAQLALLKGFHEMLIRDGIVAQRSNFDDGNVAKLDYSSAMGTVFQSYFEYIQPASRSTNQKVVESAGLLLAAMMRKGLSHPQAIVPLILSLWQCPWPALRGRIHDICMEALDSQESYVLITFDQTVRLSFEWDLLVRKPSNGLLSDENGEVQSYFSPLYDALKNKAKRIDFLAVALRELERNFVEMAYVYFMAEAISELPLKTLEEVAFLIRRLSDIVAISDDDLCNDVSRMARQVVLLRLKLHVERSYRITAEYLTSWKIHNLCREAENLASNPKKDHSFRRMSLGPLDVRSQGSLETLTIKDLEQMVSYPKFFLTFLA
jgi:hypothetical protein